MVDFIFFIFRFLKIFFSCFCVSVPQNMSVSHLLLQLQYVLSGKYVKSTSNSCVFQMCELEVGMSLVKVMTNGEGRVSTG